MARRLYAASTADFVYDGDKAKVGASLAVALGPEPSIATRVTSGLDVDGTPVTALTSTEGGEFRFYGTDLPTTLHVALIDGVGNVLSEWYAVHARDLGDKVDELLGLPGGAADLARQAAEAAQAAAEAASAAAAEAAGVATQARLDMQTALAVIERLTEHGIDALTFDEETQTWPARPEGEKSVVWMAPHVNAFIYPPEARDNDFVLRKYGVTGA